MGSCENCVRGIWESVGAGRAIGTSGTPAGDMHVHAST